MVYSVIYYATEAVTRAIISFIFAIKEWLERRALVERKLPEEKPAIPPGFSGFLKVFDTAGEKVYRWRGRALQIDVAIPVAGGIDPRIPSLDLTREKPPTRLHFLWAEAASPRWFEDIEALAKIAERAVKERRKSRRGGKR